MFSINYIADCGNSLTYSNVTLNCTTLIKVCTRFITDACGSKIHYMSECRIYIYILYIYIATVEPQSYGLHSYGKFGQPDAEIEYIFGNVSPNFL